MPVPFPVPAVVPNDDGWGPSTSAIPAHLADVPFAPFGKGDKIGRASDWTQTAYQKFPGKCLRYFCDFSNGLEDSKCSDLRSGTSCVLLLQGGSSREGLPPQSSTSSTTRRWVKNRRGYVHGSDLFGGGQC